MANKHLNQTTQPQAQPQQPPQGATPGLAKVSQQHAIAKTKADITAVQTIARKRTEIVLQAFDNAMADSDRKARQAPGFRHGEG
jgi:hypothetical protein